MLPSRVRRRRAVRVALVALIAAMVGTMTFWAATRSATAQDVGAAIEKANLYIEVAKYSERAADSWERYASWVNLKTGPTGQERYISYGLYDVPDLDGLLKEVGKVAGKPPRAAKLDAVMTTYVAAYLALVPELNSATKYYDARGYVSDNAAQGQALHARMVPLAKTFLIEREAMLRELRPFVRDVERLELAAIEKKEGRNLAWHAGQMMFAAGRVVDTFPKNRPTPLSADEVDEKIKAIGPQTSGAAFEEIMAGVARSADAVVDVQAFDAAVKTYAEAVAVFDRFAAENPAGLKDMKPLPGQLLARLQALREPLARSKGREFDGAGPMMAQIASVYFAMVSSSSSITRGRVRFLP